MKYLALIFIFIITACKTTPNDEKVFYGPGPHKQRECGLMTDAEMTPNNEGQIEALPCKVYPPNYPRSMALKGISGYVQFGLLLNEQGSVDKIRVIESVPVNEFDAAALKAIAKWTFKQPQVNNQPALDKELIYKLQFKIDN